jgi:hypothetical protein
MPGLTGRIGNWGEPRPAICKTKNVLVRVPAFLPPTKSPAGSGAECRWDGSAPKERLD